MISHHGDTQKDHNQSFGKSLLKSCCNPR